MRNIIIVITLTFISIFTLNAQENFIIDRKNDKSSHELGIDKFYFVHHTFADSFFMTDLNKKLSYDEMATILKNIYHGVTLTDKVNVNFNEQGETTPKLSYYVANLKGKGETFIMRTNFDNATRKFNLKVDPKDELARWYFIRGNKMVYRKDLYTKELELKKKNGKTFEIVDYYMFDNNVENDKLIKPLIDKLIKDSNNINKFYGYIYLSEYYLAKGKLKKSERSIESLSILFKNQKDIPRTYAFIVEMATTELEIMKRM